MINNYFNLSFIATLIMFVMLGFIAPLNVFAMRKFRNINMEVMFVFSAKHWLKRNNSS